MSDWLQKKWSTTLTSWELNRDVSGGSENILKFVVTTAVGLSSFLSRKTKALFNGIRLLKRLARKLRFTGS